SQDSLVPGTGGCSAAQSILEENLANELQASESRSCVRPMVAKIDLYSADSPCECCVNELAVVANSSQPTKMRCQGSECKSLLVTVWFSSNAANASRDLSIATTARSSSDDSSTLSNNKLAT